MILMACVDGRGGMAFHHRRQSQDRLVRWNLLKEAGRSPLWVAPSTAKLFTEVQQSRLRIDEAFLERAGPGSSASWRTAPWRPVPGGWSR